MQFIEIEAHNKTFLLNPSHIICAEGDLDGEHPFLNVTLSAVVEEGKSRNLSLRGEQAVQVFHLLKDLGA